MKTVLLKTIIEVDTPEPFWKTATPEKRAAAFLDWVASHTDGVGLSAEAVSRDSIYD